MAYLTHKFVVVVVVDVGLGRLKGRVAGELVALEARKRAYKHTQLWRYVGDTSAGHGMLMRARKYG